MISIAKTGSDKTLGFILPAIVHTLKYNLILLNIHINF